MWFQDAPNKQLHSYNDGPFFWLPGEHCQGSIAGRVLRIQVTAAAEDLARPLGALGCRNNHVDQRQYVKEWRWSEAPSVGQPILLHTVKASDYNAWR